LSFLNGLRTELAGINFLNAMDSRTNPSISPLGTRGVDADRSLQGGSVNFGARPRHADLSSRAFTLLELLVVISIIGILAALLLPVLSTSKQKGQSIYCLNNGRQMITALTLYAGEYGDLFPPNPDDGNTIPGHNWCSGKAGRGGSGEFNPDLLKDPKRSLLLPFLQGNIAVFRCPADKRMGPYQGTDPAYVGQVVPSVRTFSMNQAVGTICPAYDAGSGHGGAPTLAVNGPWLDNSHHHRRDSPWLTFGKLSTIRGAGPSTLWVLVDENDAQLNDAAFAFGMARSIWYDLPGTYHNGGCGFAFADGHSESHRWSAAIQRQGRGPWPTQSADDLRDWLWMRERTSANINGAMPPPAQ
jgi:prepilin-type N-terminal cleavage/methylation domain-containing protein/prepilin-type processing-associated H-X9-DG protein